MTTRAKRGRRRDRETTADAQRPLPAISFPDRWYGKLALLLLSVALLTFSFAPFGQFYLSWIGLVPWLLVLHRVRSQRAAFFWSWVGGIFFFTANMWWLVYVTGPGMIALMVLLGLYWALAGVVIRGAGLLPPREYREHEDGGSRIDDGGTPPARSSILYLPSSSPVFSVLLIPAVWVGFEWLRGTWPLQGLPWLYLGHPQTPTLVTCQIADLAGAFGVSFWVAAVNTLVALFVLYPRRARRRLVSAATMVVGMLALVLGYGLLRLSEDATAPGPTVMVVQSNYPQSNTGDKGATYQEMLEFHLGSTDAALRARPAGAPPVELVVWSETMMPELNPETRRQFAGTPEGQFYQDVHDLLSELTAKHRVALLAGGIFSDKWRERKQGRWTPRDRRNSAYLFDPTGRLSDQRYDKIHIVPFGEYLPFKSGFPPLYRLFVALSPYGEEYTLTPGSVEAVTLFTIPAAAAQQESPGPAGAGGDPTRQTYRFATPICFEDIDPALVARMFRGADGRKAADLIVNITNDGWFKYNEMPQHLQAAVFRSIENRVPTARSVNTGISGFIDSEGQTHDLIRAGTEGTATRTLLLDARYTLYTRVGDLFAIACAVLTAIMAVWAVVRWIVVRGRARAVRTGSPDPNPI